MEHPEARRAAISRRPSSADSATEMDEPKPRRARTATQSEQPADDIGHSSVQVADRGVDRTDRRGGSQAAGTLPAARHWSPPQRTAPPPTAGSGGRRTRGVAGILAVAGALVIAIVVATAWLISGSASRGASAPIAPHASAGSDRSPNVGPSRASDHRSARSTTAAGSGSNANGVGSAEDGNIHVTKPAGVAKPFQAVPITGTQPGAPETDLQVQRLERGRWLAFPLPTQTDMSGQFATYVELNVPGQYWLRVVDPKSGATSEQFPVTIRR